VVTLLDTVTSVCGRDTAWLQSRSSTFRELADTAASKFAVYDAVMHTKLCVALAAAGVCPASDWLRRQQGALLAVLRAEAAGGGAGATGMAMGLGGDAAQLRAAYDTWDAEVDAELRPFL